MAPDPVEIVRRALAAQAEDDGAALAALADPDIVIDTTRNVFNPGTYEGLAGMERWREGIGEVWEDLRFEDVELVPAGGNRVVVIGRMKARGRGSHVEVDRPNGQVWTVENGLVTRLELGFTSHEDALAAAGLG